MSIIKSETTDGHNNTYFGRCQEQINKGRTSVDRFLECATSAGYECRKSTTQEDKYSHIDYYIYKGSEKQCSIDIKSKSRYGWTCEVVNNWGYSGSVFGKQDYIVYVTDQAALFVEPSKLINYYKSRTWNGKKNSFDAPNMGEDKFNHTFGRMTQNCGNSDKKCQDEWFIIPDNIMQTLACHTIHLTKPQI